MSSFKKIIPFLVLAPLFLLGASCVKLGSTANGPMGMFRSADKGESWAAITALPTAKGVGSIASLKVYRVYEDPSDDNTMYLTTRGEGVYYTNNNGDTWAEIAQMRGRWIYGFSVNSRNRCLIYATDGSQIFRTSDCTRTWNLVYTEQRTARRIFSLAIDYGKEDYVYALEDNGEILVSEDGGKSWRTQNRLGIMTRDLYADPFVPGRLYLATYRNGLWRSEDRGETWKNLSDKMKDFSDSSNYYRFVFHPGKKDNIFWISKYGILRSDDGGDSWYKIELLTPPGSVNIYGFAINPANEREMYYTGTILGEKNVHIRSTFYKSVDGGVNWITKKLPTNMVPVVLRLLPSSPSTLFLGFTNLQE